jgi:hypothetical protein
MPSAGFEPATPATKRPQTYVLDRAATDVGMIKSMGLKIIASRSPLMALHPYEIS